MAKSIEAVAGTAKTPALKVKNKALLTAAQKALGQVVAHEAAAAGKYATAATAISAFALKEYGEDQAPWFVLTYPQLPDAIRTAYDTFTANLEAVGHSNPAVAWGRVRDAAAKEAQAQGTWAKFKERVAEQAARREKMLEANRAAKKKSAEAAKAPAPASAPRVQSATPAPTTLPTGKPTAEQAATAAGGAPEMSQAQVIAKLSAPEQAMAAFAIGIRQACQTVRDTPDADPVLVATAKAVSVAFEAIAPRVAELERKINRLRTGSAK